MTIVPNPLSTAKAAAEAKLAAIKAEATKAESKVVTFAKKYGPAVAALVVGVLAGHYL